MLLPALDDDGSCSSRSPSWNIDETHPNHRSCRRPARRRRRALARSWRATRICDGPRVRNFPEQAQLADAQQWIRHWIGGGSPRWKGLARDKDTANSHGDADHGRHCLDSQAVARAS
jgi:hypothetical protein